MSISALCRPSARIVVLFCTGVLLVLLTVGCATTASANSPALPAFTSTPKAQPLIEYRRSGGFAGFDDHLTIAANRRAVVTRQPGASSMLRLDKRTFDRLRRQLDKADFARLQGDHLPANTCCDLFEYTITYRGRTVRTMDTAVPEALQPAIRSLNEVVERSSRLNGG